MFKIGIIPNTNYDSNFKFTNEIVTWLNKNNAKPCLIKNNDLSCDFENIMFEENEFYEMIDFLVILGGDGTILHIAPKASILSIPIMGINIGHLGYLTDVDKEHYAKSLSNLINGNFKLEKRMMLTAYVNSPENSIDALNEVAILRENSARIVRVKLSINDEYIDTYRGDGVLISTPTGSTAYNLSAGGPILKPDGEMIAITQIAPHTLYARPLVIPSSDIIRAENANEENLPLEVFIDGYSGFKLEKDDVLYVEKSKYYTTTVKTDKENNVNFYDILREKLNCIR